MSAYPALFAKSVSRLQALRDLLWLLLALLPPLWVLLSAQQPFEPPKAALVRTLVWLLTAVTLARALLHRSRPRPLPARLLATTALLATAIVVSTAAAVDWRLSLWGSYERSQGALTLLSYLLLFLLAATHLGAPSRARRLLAVMVATSVPLVLTALLQAAGWNPFALLTDARSPLYATLGRANFLGAYLALLAPLTLALLLTTPRRRLLAVLLATQLLIIALSLARGAWLATALSLSLFALLWWRRRLVRNWRSLAYSAGALLFLGGPLSVFLLARLQLPSAAARLLIWQKTAALIAQRPLLGYGSDSLGLLFPRVYPPQLVYDQGRDFFVDRAHNLFLDWALWSGIPGLLAYGLLLLTFAVFVLRALQRPLPQARRALLLATLAAVLGNLANNMVSFDVTPTATASWLLMGIGLALARSTPAAPSPSSTPTAVLPARVLQQRTLCALLCGLIFLTTGLAIWHFNARPLLADVAARAARQYAARDNQVSALAAARRAVAYWPDEPAHALLLARLSWQQAFMHATPDPALLAQAESALLTAQQLRPAAATIWLHSAQFYATFPHRDGAERDRAGDAYRRALALAPNEAAIYVAWGQVYLQQGNAAAAAPLLRRAVALDATLGQAYLHLAAAELALGRRREAQADYREAVRLFSASAGSHAAAANTGLAPQLRRQIIQLQQALHDPP